MTEETRVAAGHPSPAVRAAARRLTRTWLVSLAGAGLMPLVTLALAVATLLWGEGLRWSSVLWIVWTVPLAYNVTRFVPRPAAADQTLVALSETDADSFARWIESVVPGWRPAVRLGPSIDISVESGTLTIGLPFVFALRRDELAALVADMHLFEALDQHPSTRLARRLAVARLGGSLRRRDGTDSRPSRRLLHRIDVAAADFGDATSAWAEDRRAQRGREWQQIAEVRDAVEDAWVQICLHWLLPALKQGVWHTEPYSGMCSLLEASEREGLVDLGERPPGEPATALLGDPAHYEAALSVKLAQSDHQVLVPARWDDHPSAVTVPTARQTLAAALVAADRSTGRTQSATLDTIMTLLEEGWAETLVAVFNDETTSSPDARPSVRDALQDLLTAGTAVAVLDAGLAEAVWEWPMGTRLIGDDGHALPISAAVSDALDELHDDGGLDRLRVWLATQGVDSGAALWLGEGTAPARERARWAFPCHRGVRGRIGVLSTHALRLFAATSDEEDAPSVRHAVDGTLIRKRMAAVNVGNHVGQVSVVMFADVIVATFSPTIGGLRWRLRLTTADGSTSTRGNRSPTIERELVERLGDRLHRPWSRRPRWVLAARNVVGLTALALAALSVLMLPWVLVNPLSGSSRVAAVVLVPLTAGFLLLAVLPDVLARAWDRTSRRAP